MHIRRPASALLRSLTVLAAIVSLAPSRAEAAIPQTISMSGTLLDASGNARADGSYNVTFRLYDALTAGNLRWTEASKPVFVAGGRGQFSTALGTPTPFGALVFDQPLFLEVQVAGDAAMTPRLPLQSVPYTLSPSGTTTLALPFAGTVNTGGVALNVGNTGSGGAIQASSSSASANAVTGISTGAGVAGVAGVNTGPISGRGVYGRSDNGGAGVYGTSQNGYGVHGNSVNDIGVYGTSSSSSANAVTGISTGAGVAGVAGVNNGPISGRGVYGRSDNGGAGVHGTSQNGYGVHGNSLNDYGVLGTTASATKAAASGINSASGPGVYGRSDGGGYAGLFAGRVRVDVLEIAGGADLAETFNVSEHASPGTVMAIDTANAGLLCIAQGAYNRRVAGIVSGANNLAAGVVLSDPAVPKGGVAVAMTGRVWVKCDASGGAIEPGDLLTTSDTPGHAMRVADHALSQGATLGKAMTSLREGQGMVLALVSLQ